MDFRNVNTEWQQKSGQDLSEESFGPGVAGMRQNGGRLAVALLSVAALGAGAAPIEPQPEVLNNTKQVVSGEQVKDRESRVQEFVEFVVGAIREGKYSPEELAGELIKQVGAGSLPTGIFEKILVALDLRQMNGIPGGDRERIALFSHTVLKSFEVGDLGDYKMPEALLVLLQANLQVGTEVKNLATVGAKRAVTGRDERAAGFQEENILDPRLTAQILSEETRQRRATTDSIMAEWNRQEQIEDERRRQTLERRELHAAANVQADYQVSDRDLDINAAQSMAASDRFEGETKGISRAEYVRRRLDSEWNASYQAYARKMDEALAIGRRNEGRREQLRKELDQRWKETEAKIMKAVTAGAGG